jgi:uncharacterized DUF497 family protein
MVRYLFEWDPAKERANIRKHRISFRQAATVFRDPNQISVYDEMHSNDEDRWITMGRDVLGVVRIVVHTAEEIAAEVLLIRIISARRAAKNELKQYRGGR